MIVTIDPNSGFCYGVSRAVEMAERELKKNGKLYCLGDVVHNNKEVKRLSHMGLIIISMDEFKALTDCTVMIRAHGEPPETYQTALQNNITLIDATCPIVLNLQKKIRNAYLEMQEKNGQVVIFGKKDHAEVNGLKGQTRGSAIIISTKEESDNIELERPVRLYAQTTMNMESFHEVADTINERVKLLPPSVTPDFIENNTVCRQVSNRSSELKIFASEVEVVIFVSGQHSSNGLNLYTACKSVNPATYLVSGKDELRMEWFENIMNIGICGATSTPVWLMEEVAEKIRKIGN
jgi:4-hydroxy-3-methylbut-2-enyl diphosphate reductase